MKVYSIFLTFLFFISFSVQSSCIETYQTAIEKEIIQVKNEDNFSESLVTDVPSVISQIVGVASAINNVSSGTLFAQFAMLVQGHFIGTMIGGFAGMGLVFAIEGVDYLIDKKQLKELLMINNMIVLAHNRDIQSDLPVNYRQKSTNQINKPYEFIYQKYFTESDRHEVIMRMKDIIYESDVAGSLCDGSLTQRSRKNKKAMLKDLIRKFKLEII